MLYKTWSKGILINTFSLGPSVDTGRPSSWRICHISLPSPCLWCRSPGPGGHSAASASRPEDTRTYLVKKNKKQKLCPDNVRWTDTAFVLSLTTHFQLSSIASRCSHLHWWVFVIRCSARGELNGCDPKTPNICFEIITPHLWKQNHVKLLQIISASISY